MTDRTAPEAPPARKAYQAKVATDPWWLTAAGIRGHYDEEREQAIRHHNERMKRLNDEELAALDAYDKFIAKGDNS